MRKMLILVLVVLAGAQRDGVGDPARLLLDARFEEGGRLRVRIEIPGLPERAFVRVQVQRVLSTSRTTREVGIANVAIPFTGPGVAEGVVETAAEGAAPGLYRVRAVIEARGQYPEVVEALQARGEPVTAEIMLGNPVSLEYLRAVARERALLGKALRDVAEFLGRLQEAEAATAADHAAGIARWQAIRERAIPMMEGIIEHGREVRDRYYPETYMEFAERYLFTGLYQAESRKFSAASSGGEYHATGMFHAREDVALEAGMLAPYVRTFWIETEKYQLEAWKYVIAESCKGIGEMRARPDRERWSRARAGWEGVTDRWRVEAGSETAPPGESPHGADFQRLWDAVQAWWSAEEMTQFPPPPPATPPAEGEPVPPAPPDPAALRDAVLEILARLEVDLV